MWFIMQDHKYQWKNDDVFKSDLVFNVHLAEGMRFADSRTGDTYQVVSISKVNVAEREGLIKTSTGEHLSEEELTTLRERNDIDHSWPYVVIS